jgi:hypothetical protein
LDSIRKSFERVTNITNLYFADPATSLDKISIYGAGETIHMYFPAGFNALIGFLLRG